MDAYKAMDTPIDDFVRNYAESGVSRLHMPGHKGADFTGCEAFDITEIKGADALYEASGIILESEKNASRIFGSSRTLYSTEGSSQCIKAMLHLIITNRPDGTLPLILAARNAHKAYLYAQALLDFDTEWLYGESSSVCACPVSPESLQRALDALPHAPAAVYVTSPDYLGNTLDIAALAEVCHKSGTLLAVDNAHGAYLKFLNQPVHPMDLGADICCDSAHKTLPVLTGGAYLHISKNAPEAFCKYAKSAMALYGSTSPSYLTLHSLDLCNKYLCGDYPERLEKFISRLDFVRSQLREMGWQILKTDPLKITLAVPDGITGEDLAEALRRGGAECEYADPEYTVLMFTPENTEKDFARVISALGSNERAYLKRAPLSPIKSERAMTVREAMFSKQETVNAKDSPGRICGAPTVGCPPAIPIVVSGERIEKEALDLFEKYGIKTVDVVK